MLLRLLLLINYLFHFLIQLFIIFGIVDVGINIDIIIVTIVLTNEIGVTITVGNGTIVSFNYYRC